MFIGKNWIGVVGVAAVLFSACSPKGSGTASKVVHVASWSNYMTPEILAQFTKETGFEVKVSHYSSNEELLAKLQAGAAGYDVAVPSDYMVLVMIKLGLLEKLDAAKISHRKGVSPRFLGMFFDPKNEFSVPYDWGITAFAVNREKVKTPVLSWKEFFSREELKGKMSLLDDTREALGAVLKSQGLSLNTVKPNEIEGAKKRLLEIKGRLKAFTSEALVPLVDGDLYAAQIYLSDALQARKRSGGKIEFVIPEEGATKWIDNLVVPKGAANIEGAHQFINYLLRPDVAAQTTLSVFVSPAIDEVKKFLPPEMKTDPLLFPSDSVMSRLEMMEDLGEATALFDRAWTEVKAGEE